jgi:hypothetical protein
MDTTLQRSFALYTSVGNIDIDSRANFPTQLQLTPSIDHQPSYDHYHFYNTRSQLPKSNTFRSFAGHPPLLGRQYRCNARPQLPEFSILPPFATRILRRRQRQHGLQ